MFVRCRKIILMTDKVVIRHINIANVGAYHPDKMLVMFVS